MEKHFSKMALIYLQNNHFSFESRTFHKWRKTNHRSAWSLSLWLSLSWNNNFIIDVTQSFFFVLCITWFCSLGSQSIRLTCKIFLIVLSFLELWFWKSHLFQKIFQEKLLFDVMIFCLSQFHYFVAIFFFKMQIIDGDRWIFILHYSYITANYYREDAKISEDNNSNKKIEFKKNVNKTKYSIDLNIFIVMRSILSFFYRNLALAAQTCDWSRYIDVWLYFMESQAKMYSIIMLWMMPDGIIDGNSVHNDVLTYTFK